MVGEPPSPRLPVSLSPHPVSPSSGLVRLLRIMSAPPLLIHYLRDAPVRNGIVFLPLRLSVTPSPRLPVSPSLGV